MQIDINELTQYDYANAKVGDKVIYAYMSSWGVCWSFETCTIKSVSPKRGDISLNGDVFKPKFDKYGRVIGRGRYDTSHSLLLEYNEDNIKEVTAYIKYDKLLFKTKERLYELCNNGYAEVRNMPEEKLERLYALLTE